MAWNSFATPLIGKAVRAASRLAHGGGSAFPGKIVEQIDPQFLARTLRQLPLGVVLVSGTNGKTTTTRMVASMLESLGLKVFTNPTGSNFTRGVVSSLLAEVSLGGKLDADIAVLELDEAYAVHFVKQVQPDYCLLLNVMRDQLDRFGEIDNTAKLLSKAAEATTGTVVLNREDPRMQTSRILKMVWKCAISDLTSRCAASSLPTMTCARRLMRNRQLILKRQLVLTCPNLQDRTKILRLVMLPQLRKLGNMQKNRKIQNLRNSYRLT